MAVEGSLDLFRLPEILQMISQQGKTGILTVQGQQDIVAVSFLRGRIVAADALTHTVEEGLAQVLVSEGLVSAAEFARASAEQQADGGRLLDLLVDRGYLSRQQLLAALRLQTRRQLEQLLGWDQGDFKFYSGDEVSYEEGFTPISVEDLLLRTLDQLAEAPLARAGFPMPPAAAPLPGAAELHPLSPLAPLPGPFSLAGEEPSPAPPDQSALVAIFPVGSGGADVPATQPARPPSLAGVPSSQPGMLAGSPGVPAAFPGRSAAPAEVPSISSAGPSRSRVPPALDPGAGEAAGGAAPLKSAPAVSAAALGSAAGSFPAATLRSAAGASAPPALPAPPTAMAARPAGEQFPAARRQTGEKGPADSVRAAPLATPLPLKLRQMTLERQRETTPAARAVSGVLAAAMAAAVIAALRLAPQSIPLPFPWQGNERAALLRSQRDAFFQKIDGAAKTYFLLEGRFPDRLSHLARAGLLAPADLHDPRGEPLLYSAHEESYSLQPVEDGRPLAELGTSGAITGNFFLDPLLFVPSPSTTPPLVLLD